MKDKLTIRFSGPQGAGIQSAAEICASLFQRSGYHVFAASDFESRIIGGYSFSQITVSTNPTLSVNRCPDIAFSFTSGSLQEDRKLCTGNPLYFAVTEDEHSKKNLIPVPVSRYLESGQMYAKNVFFLGVLSGVLDLPEEAVFETIEHQFVIKGEKTVAENTEVAEKGIRFGKQHRKDAYSLASPRGNPGKILKNGAEAVSLGAVAAGIKFFSAYPMSPSTSVMNSLSSYSKDFGIFVEQAEDEIAAINLVLGASYAGVRSMTATSGGGLALMSESISLAAVSETPAVIVNAQRPGPATGLPTKTGQQDLSMALSIGHGEFSRVVLAPGTPARAFLSTQKAFYLAEKYQVPVFVLTDQYLMDSLFQSGNWEISEEYRERFIESGDEPSEPGLYRRYPLEINGELRRRIPGNSSHLVLADSHIHDEFGLISEDCAVTEQLTQKLLSKNTHILNDLSLPELSADSGEILLVGWGSTYGVIGDVCRELSQSGFPVRQMHFHDLYPLHRDYVQQRASESEKIFVIENNAAGQLASLLSGECGIRIDERILKYNGRPFYFDELLDRVKGRIS